MKQLKGDIQEFIDRSKHERCISSVPQLNGNSIEFSLSTWTRRMIKLSQAKSLQKATFHINYGLFEPLVIFFGITNSPATF